MSDSGQAAGEDTQVQPRNVLAVGAARAGLLLACPGALALNPALDVSRYPHTSWKVEDGSLEAGSAPLPRPPKDFGLIQLPRDGQSLDKAITTAADAVAEGRSAIQDLRLHPSSGGDLAELLTAAGQQMAHSEAPGNPPVFRVTVERARQGLEPPLQFEVYGIARELRRNAFRHAQAGHIEVEIRYESRQLRVHVRDDGKGIDPEVLKAGGSAGHGGLPGTRERVDRFGGKLEFWSEAAPGTEAVLTVPAGVAFATSSAASGWWARIWAVKQ